MVLCLRGGVNSSSSSGQDDIEDTPTDEEDVTTVIGAQENDVSLMSHNIMYIMHMLSRA